MTPTLDVAFGPARARVRLAHRNATTAPVAAPDPDPVLCLVRADDGDPALIVGVDNARSEAQHLLGAPYVLTVTVTPIGPLSGLDITNLLAHLHEHPNGGI